MPGVLDSTKQELDERLKAVGLGDYIDFIHDKVYSMWDMATCITTIGRSPISSIACSDIPIMRKKFARWSFLPSPRLCARSAHTRVSP